jgi:hypothetical protein
MVWGRLEATCLAKQWGPPEPCHLKRLSPELSRDIASYSALQPDESGIDECVLVRLLYSIPDNTMDGDDTRESLRLVRMYSWEVDNRIPSTSRAYQLSQALINQRDALDQIAAPWRALLEPTSPTAAREYVLSGRLPLHDAFTM